MASYHRFRGEKILVWLDGVTPECIDSELSYDQVIMHGGLGERGGFSADVLASDVAGLTFTKETVGVQWPFTSAAGATSLLSFTARRPGDYGNEITVTVLNNGGLSTALSVRNHGRDIRIILATDGAGVATSTAAQVKAAMDAVASVADLVETTVLQSGTVAVGVTSLTGGEGRTGQLLGSFRKTNGAVWSLAFGDPAMGV